MSTFQSFTIRCSRDIYNAAEDDVITIKPRWNELTENYKMMEYVVHHRVAPCSAPEGASDKSEQILYGSNLQNYVGNLIEFLAVDIQPFKQIQFDFPCMPSVVVEPKQLPSIHHAIIHAVYGMQEFWPTTTIKKAKKTCSNHLNAHAEPFVPAEAYRTPQRPATRSSAPAPAPPRIERPVARHIFFDEEDGHVTRYFN
jgi:hypothetical protein